MALCPQPTWNANNSIWKAKDMAVLVVARNLTRNMFFFLFSFIYCSSHKHSCTVQLDTELSLNNIHLSAAFAVRIQCKSLSPEGCITTNTNTKIKMLQILHALRCCCAFYATNIPNNSPLTTKSSIACSVVLMVTYSFHNHLILMVIQCQT